MSGRFVQLWTAEEDATLQRLWAAGVSSAEISRRMDKTKNAVLGRVHRLKLASRPSPIPFHTTERKPREPRAKPLPRRARTLPPLPSDAGEAAAAREPVDVSAEAYERRSAAAKQRAVPVSGLDPARIGRSDVLHPSLEALLARRGCCWPIGEPRYRDFRFCDAPDVVEGRVYCAAHLALAFVPKRAASGGAVRAEAGGMTADEKVAHVRAIIRVVEDLTIAEGLEVLFEVMSTAVPHLSPSDQARVAGAMATYWRDVAKSALRKAPAGGRA